MGLGIKLRRVLGIRAEESTRTGYMFGYYFLCSLAMIIVETAGAALFIARCGDLEILGFKGVVLLPVIWIVSGLVVVPVASVVVEKIQELLTNRLGVRLDRMVIPTTLFLVSMLGMFRFLFSGYEAESATWVLYTFPLFLVSAEVLYTFMTINMEVSANQLFNVREAKRVFGAIGSGPVLADIVGGSLIPIIMLLVGSTENLLFVSMSILLLSVAVFLPISRKYRSAFVSGDEEGGSEASSNFSPLKNQYVLLVALSVIFAQLAYYLVDFQLMTVAEDRYAGKDEELAAFFGLLFASVGVLKLLLQLFVTNRLIARVGLFTVLLVLPVGLILFSSLTLFSPLGLFAALVLLKGWDDSFRYTFNSSGQPLLYQVFPSRESSAAQNFVTGKADPFAVGASGLLILILASNFVDIDNISMLCWVLLAVAVAWIATVISIKRRYLKTLTHYLSGNSSVDGLDLTSPEVIAQLYGYLRGNDHEQALHSLAILRRANPPDLLEHLPIEALSTSEHERFKVAILETISQCNPRDAEQIEALVRVVEPFLAEDCPQETRRSAIETYCTLMEEDAIESVAPVLQHSDPDIRASAVFGLVSHSGIEGMLLAGPVLQEMLKSGDPAERKAVASMVGRAGIRTMRKPLSVLMQDDDVDVRKAAILSASQIHEPRLYQQLLAALSDYHVQHVARQAIIEHVGNAIIPAAKIRLADRSVALRNRAGVVRMLGALPSEDIAPILIDSLNIPIEDFRNEVLDALVLCAAHNRVYASDDFHARLKEDCEIYFETLQVEIDLAEFGHNHLLENACFSRREEVRDRIWRLLSLLYAPETVDTARLKLQASNADTRAAGLELLDTILERQDRESVLLVFDDLSNSEKLRQVATKIDCRPMQAKERLSWILAPEQKGLPAWLRMCALHVARQQSFGESMRCDEVEYELIQSNHIEDGESMESVIECIVFLRGIPWFEGIRDDFLARIAENVDEVFLKSGAEVIKQGDLGDFMYIIKKGRVRVHANGQHLTELGASAFFGEMAILDAEPRSASITTIEDSVFYKLSHEALVEAMGNEVNVSLGIVRALSRRLRLTNTRNTAVLDKS